MVYDVQNQKLSVYTTDLVKLKIIIKNAGVVEVKILLSKSKPYATENHWTAL